MKRIKGNYLYVIETVVPLAGKRVLEIRCGNGSRTIQIAERCLEAVAIEPDSKLIAEAKSKSVRPTISHEVGSADKLAFDHHIFDIVFFTLSFHHIPMDLMTKAIEEVLNVVTENGYIIFLEPAFAGSFFEAEIRFDARDGDERKEKAAAYTAMLSHQRLRKITELADGTVFTFDGASDFMESLHPKRGSQDEISAYLEKCEHTLKADRRINIFQLR